jgi:O-antigen/teichoic acid export membrane protein
MLFWKNLSARTLIVLINQISILIALPIVAYRLGIKDFGVLSVAMIIFQVSFMLTEWGFGIPAIKESSDANNKKDLGRMFFDVNIIKAIILFFIILVLCLSQLSNVLTFNNQALFYSLVFAVIAGAFNPLWYFQAIEKSQKLIIPSLLGRLLYLVIIFFLVLDSSSMNWVLTAQGITYLITTIWGLYFVKPYLRNIRKFDLRKLKTRFKNSVPFFLSGAITNQFHSIWGLFLISVAGPIEVAIFNLADQGLRAGGAFTNILPEVFLLRRLSEGSSIKNNKRIKLAIFTLLILSITGLLITDKIISIFFGPSYLLAVNVIQVTIIIWLLLAFIKLLGYPLLGIRFGLERVNKFNYIFFALNIIGIILWANVGNFTALFLSYFVLTTCFIYLMIQVFLFKSNWITR